MRAVVWTKYGPPEVLELRELPKPTPKDNELLIRIYATTVTAGDSEMRSLRFPIYLNVAMRAWVGLLKPKPNTIPGTELAGEIEAVGKDVKRFKVGDQVFGTAGMSFGANAEYICIPDKPGEMEGGVTLKPTNMTYEEAACVPFGARDSLHFLRLGNVGAGQKVLINGAGGSIGSFGVQLAKHFGAEVTAIDSAPKLDMLRSVGADHVIDYTKESFLDTDRVYDVIFDVVGTLSLSRSKKALKDGGVYLLANPMRGQLVTGPWTRMTSNYQVLMQTATPNLAQLDYLRGLIEEGRLKAVIDRTYPLDQIVEAHRYVDGGGKLGNLVITV